jgi:cation:H+ antiporter
MMYIYALGGFVLLFGGGEWLVRGAVAVSRRFRLSPLLIGMTVVAWCTSAPELVVSMGAALEGRSDIAIGNIVGSNIFNVLGVLGATALIAPIVVRPSELRRDTAVMIASSVVIALVAQTGEIGAIAGAVLTAGIVAYVVISYRSELKDSKLPSAELHVHESEEIEAPSSAWAGVGYLTGGLAALVVGSRLLIIGATDIALLFGVSEAVIGLTLVAVGTSLPELATSVVAAIRKHSDVAVGNVVGSNIFNLLGILGITSLVRPIGVAEQIARVDVWVMLAIAIALAPLLLIKGRIGRAAGVVSLTLYMGYVVFLFA